ncbi:MAG: STAS domain-containing protein [bacterium]|nr:STAS domain-containing protein [bacterium]
MIEISNTEEENVQILKVIGDVDASSSIHLDSALAEAIEKNKNIIVDLGQLNYISSAGLGVFMSYLKELDANSLKLVLSGLNEKVFHVFEILGLDQLLTIKEDLDKARAELNEV